MLKWAQQFEHQGHPQVPSSGRPSWALPSGGTHRSSSLQDRLLVPHRRSTARLDEMVVGSIPYPAEARRAGACV